MEEELAKVTIKDPMVPLISNVTSKAVRNNEEIKELLVKHVISPVRWIDSLGTVSNNGVGN